MTIARRIALIVAVVSLGGAVDAAAKILSLEDRCRCVEPWRDHGQYVRCVKRNAKRYVRFEARFTPASERRRLSRAEVRTAARALVTDALASRCGMPEHRCDLRDRPCPAGETCDVRRCDETAGVCVPVPESCPAGGKPRCTCGSETDPFGRTYPNDCERLRADARLDGYANAPHTQCPLSCGGPEGLECPAPLVCRYPYGTCDAFSEHGRCEEAPPANTDPVCGCDGTTYAGSAAAGQAGTRVAFPGECGALCAGPAGRECAAGLPCMKDWGRCGESWVWGICRAAACLPLGPVCGCDGKIYPRACDAVFAGTDVDGYPIDGACAAS